MSTSSSYIDNCLLLVPVVVGGAAVGGGAELAIGTAMASVAVVFNLFLAERATRRLVQTAAGTPDPSALGGFIFKQLTTLPLALAIMMLVGPLALALALLTLLGGVVLQVVVQLVQSSDARAVFGPEESAC